MALTVIKQKILFLGSRILLRFYNLVILSLIIFVMVWHRSWSFKLKDRN